MAEVEKDVPNKKISVLDLIYTVLCDTTTTPEQKIILIDELRKNNPGASDRWAYRWSLWIMGGSIILTILSVSVLAFYTGKVPEGLLSIGTGVVGALAGLLAPRSGSDSGAS